ncbi:MAG TPA: hypothetical protein VF381_04370 [Thermoanaerobaculia bacterium]
MRIAYAFVAAVVCLTTAMFWMSAVGWHWNPWLLLLCGAGALAGVRRRAAAPSSTLSLTAILAFTLLTAYGALTARETCADLLYFWGPKAVRFAAARGIDVAFLKAPDHFLMHPDYPPLVPLLYAWGAMIAGGFSYWGPLLLTALLLGVTAMLVPGRGGVLLAALLAFGYAQALAAGAADPMLILFEVAALCALTFLDDPVLASIALAGAAMTKVEGAAFVAVTIVAYAIVSRRPLRALAIAIAPAILLGSWIAFARSHGLLDSYARGTTPLVWSSDAFGALAKAASYHAYYLPWLAVLAPLAFAKRWKRAGLPLLVAIGSLAYILFFYMHADANRDFWIAVSAERVLLTPLAALAVAAAASSE